MKKTLRTGLLALAALSGSAAAATIDVAIVYTNAAKNSVSNIDTKINQYISYSNRIYTNNAINTQLRLAGKASTSVDRRPTENDLNTITASSGYQNFKSSNNADMLVLLGKRENVQGGYVCGIGWVGQGANGSLYSSQKGRMYSVSAVDCGDVTFVHELGHNMGLGHSVKQGNIGGVFRDGVGHGVDNNFSTIMAYPQAFGSAVRLDWFSDPDWDACNGLPCGVQGQSNAYRAVNAVVDQIAAFE